MLREEELERLNANILSSSRFVTAMHSESKDDMTEENAAKAKCQELDPPRNLDLLVTIRSPNDPYAIAAAEAGCDYDFGPTAEEVSHCRERPHVSPFALTNSPFSLIS